MPFDPTKHLSDIKGKEYLEVKWRLVWLRDAHPEAEIATQLVEHRFNEYALFKATVTIHLGEGFLAKGEGHGSETPRDFGDYIEKAETKAIGRALAALGFGTQFTTDFDEDMTPGRERIADSPVARNGVKIEGDRPASSYARSEAPGATNGQKTVSNTGAPATERQLGFAQAVAREIGMDEPDLHKLAQEFTPEGFNALNRQQASDLIERLQSLRQATR